LTAKAGAHEDGFREGPPTRSNLKVGIAQHGGDLVIDFDQLTDYVSCRRTAPIARWRPRNRRCANLAERGRTVAYCADRCG
jgi:hypothetical protein